MKALILAAGRGNRINEVTRDQNKCMLKVAEKTLLEFSLERSIHAGVDEMVIVVGYKAHNIINSFGYMFNGIPITYVNQRRQSGLVHAIECAEEALEGDDFMLTLGDEIIIKPRSDKLAEEFKERKCFGLCGVVEQEDREEIRKTYTVFLGQDERILRLIEKPRIVNSNIMGTGNCILKNEILNYIPLTPIHHERKEKELPDLIQCAVDDGHIIYPFLIGSDYININSFEELKKAENILRRLHGVH